MLAKRIIPCLDVKDGRVVKGVNFVGLRDAGDPVESAQRYSAGGADEITFLDITASHENRRTLFDLVDRTASTVAVPLTVGGGVRERRDVNELLHAGADKVSINSAAVANPSSSRTWPRHMARRRSWWPSTRSESPAKPASGPCIPMAEGVTRGSTRSPGPSEMADYGAGEILLTSMDRDGTRDGYDLGLNSRSCGRDLHTGCSFRGVWGPSQHVREGLAAGGADAALAASIFHDGHYTVAEVKEYLLQPWGVRPPARGETEGKR